MQETFFPRDLWNLSLLHWLPPFLSVSVRHRSSKRIRAGAQRGSRGVAKAAYVELVSSQWKCKSAFARRPFTPTQSPFGTKLHCPLPVSSGQHVRFFGEFLIFESKYHWYLFQKFTFDFVNLFLESNIKDKIVTLSFYSNDCFPSPFSPFSIKNNRYFIAISKISNSLILNFS